MEDQTNEVGQSLTEETTPALQPQTRRTRISPVVAVLLLIVIGLIAWAIAGRRQAWDSAAYLPKEVAVAVTVDLSSTSDKAAGRECILAILKDAGLNDPEKEAFGALKNGLKIDVQREIIPHLNGKGGLAVGTQMSGMAPDITLVIGAKSDAAAKKVLKVVEDRLRAEGVTMTSAKHEEYDYFKINTGTVFVCVGVVDSGIVVTAGEDSFKKSIDNHNGKTSLRNNEYYTEYKTDAKSTIATAFYSGPGLYKLVGPFMAMGLASMGPEAPEQMQKALESTTAAVCSAQLSGTGLKMLVKGLSTESSPDFSMQPLDELVAGAPADSAVFVSFQEVDKLWNAYESQMEKMPGGMARLGEMTGQVKELLGVDLFKDVVGRLKSVKLYYLPKPPASPGGFGGELLCALKVDSASGMSGVMSKVHSALAKLPDWNVKQISVAGQSAAVISGDQDSVRIVDAVVGDELVLALTGDDGADAAKSVLAALKSRGSGLSSSKGFQAVKAGLPDRSWGIVYVDAGRFVRAFQSEITPGDSRKAALAVTKRVGPVGMTSSTKGKESEGVVFIPFLR